jgi:pimeloyl-ACP methyl ester carboxylesterase
VLRTLLAVVVGSALLVGCGGHERKGQRAATVKTPPSPGVVGPGRLVGIGGGRGLFVECVGSGSPSVVLEAGLGADARSWRDVQAQPGRTTRTCAYDRAGVGSRRSLPELVALLARIARCGLTARA